MSKVAIIYDSAMHNTEIIAYLITNRLKDMDWYHWMGYLFMKSQMKPDLKNAGSLE